MILLLDTGVLGALLHPRAHIADPVHRRLTALKMANPTLEVSVPEIADYELRRELLRAGKSKSVDRLDAFNALCRYVPITTSIMRHAAAIWAQARTAGAPTASDPALDGDVILAAQALSVGATVVTTNRRHLARYVAVEDWSAP